MPSGRQGFDQLALGRRDAFDGIESFHVSVADVRDYADVRAGDFGQPADFARVVHGHFEHGYAGVRWHAQDGERQADVVVEISDGLCYRHVDGQHGRDDVLGGGFSGAACYTYDLAAPLIAGPGGDMLERGQGVRDGENVSSASPLLARAANDRQSRRPHLFEKASSRYAFPS